MPDWKSNLAFFYFGRQQTHVFNILNMVIDYQTSCSFGQEMQKITHVNVIR